MDHNNKAFEIHRVSECDECSKTDWDAIKADILEGIEKCRSIGTLTHEEHSGLTKFISECSSDQIACLVQIIASGISAAQNMVEMISNASKSFAEMVMTLSGDLPVRPRRTRLDD